MDPELLQRLRENSGLRLDGEGRFFHQGEPVEHERLAMALLRGIHRAADGRWATRLGTDWAYVQVDDAARFIRSASADDAAGALQATLIDGTEERVDPRTLASGRADALYVRLAGGERARFSRAAQLSLAGRLRDLGGGRFALQLGGQLYPIGDDGGPEPVRR